MGGFGMGTGRRWLCILLVPVALAGATDAGAAIDDTGTILADDDGTPEFPRVRVPAFLESSRRVTDTYGDKPNIFLTYDDGSSVYTQRLLDVLAPYDDISVTFFVMCREAVPGTMQRILDDGHALGNHTCGHPILTSLSTASRLRQWQRLEDFVNARVEPDVDLTCQRPPFGATSRSVRADAESMGMREWGWSVDPWDWSGASVSRILAALESMDDGDIIILHDSAGSYRTVEATRIFLQRHADDYIFRSLPDCTLGRPLVWEGRFWDDDGSIFEEDIEWLAETGITKGCNPPDNDRFCPYAPVTRGQMAALLVRALGLTAGAGANVFTDDDTSIFATDIDILATAGITRGCNPPFNDRFCPDAPVTRGQMAAFLHRAVGQN